MRKYLALTGESSLGGAVASHPCHSKLRVVVAVSGHWREGLLSLHCLLYRDASTCHYLLSLTTVTATAAEARLVGSWKAQYVNFCLGRYRRRDVCGLTRPHLQLFSPFASPSCFCLCQQLLRVSLALIERAQPFTVAVNATLHARSTCATKTGGDIQGCQQPSLVYSLYIRPPTSSKVQLVRAPPCMHDPVQALAAFRRAFRIERLTVETHGLWHLQPRFASWPSRSTSRP